MAPLAPVDWARALRARVYAQYQQSNWAIPLANLIGATLQPLDDVTLALAYLFSIDPITDDVTAPGYGIGRGVQLDRIGRLVGMPRTGQTDGEYRPYLRGQIRMLRSHGTGDDIIEILKLVFAGTTLSVTLINDTATSGGRFLVRLDDNAADDVAVFTAAYFVRGGKLAGVKVWLWWSPEPDATTFTLAGELLAPRAAAARGLGDATDASVGGGLAGITVL